MKSVEPHARDDYILGKVARARGDLDAARQFFARALQRDPRQEILWGEAAEVELAAQRWPGAERCLRAALTLKPGEPSRTLQLASALLPQRRFAEMLALLQPLEAVLGEHFFYHHMLGITLLLLDRPEEAEPLFQKALRLDPRVAATHAWYGSALADLGRAEEALAACERALALDPEEDQARMQRTLLWLAAGRWEEGMEDYERRLGNSPQVFSGPTPTTPLWRGEPFPGQTLLLLAEQGYGDTLQLIRFASRARERGGRVIVECQPGLERLLERVPGIDAVFPCGAPRPAFDLHAPLLNLIRLLRLSPTTLPPWTPYLPFDFPVRPSGPLRVGIVWSGSILNMKNRSRSVPMEAFLPLREVPGVTVVSLQKFGGRGPAPLDGPLPFEDGVADCADFLDTARVVAGLDLVIAVDTAVAHLAGAMGKPVWLLLPSVSCWRWMNEREDTPWYPTARLFRQKRRGDWAELIARVAAELANISNK